VPSIIKNTISLVKLKTHMSSWYLLYITVKSLKAFPGKAKSSSRGVHGIFKPEVSTLGTMN